MRDRLAAVLPRRGGAAAVVPAYGRLPLLVALAGAIAAAGLGAVVASGRSQRVALLAAVGVVSILPLVVRALQRRFDPFEPITLLSISCFFIYFLRPLYSIAYHEYTYGPWDIRPGLNGALLIALLGTSAMYCGYFVPTGRRWGRRIRALPSDWRLQTTIHVCIGILILATLLFAAYIAQGGGLGAVKGYFSARTQQAHALAGSSSAYLYLAPYLTIPLSLILLETNHRHRSAAVLAFGWALAGIALLITVPRGDRTYILALILPLVALPYLRSGRRPRAWVMAGALIVSIVAINLLLTNRVADRRGTPIVQAAADSLTRPATQFKKFMLGPDISMFSTLSLTYDSVPKDMHYRPGNELLSVLAGPVPGTLWHHKPHDGQTYIFSLLFPSAAAQIRAGNGPSILGGFYSDSGFVGVIAYSLLLGVGARVLFEYWRRHPRNAGVRLVYAASLPLLIILLRGSFADSFGRAVYLVGPCLFVLWVAGSRSPRDASVTG